jgi:hypothetical protein
MGVSPVAGLYDEDFDRESAYEILTARAKKAAESAAAQEQAEEQQASTQSSGGSRWTLPGFGDDEPAAQPAPKQPKARSGYQRETVAEAAMKSVARTVASSLGRALVRGILGSLRR